MDYAPVSVAAPHSGAQQGRLEADGCAVRWHRFGYEYRRFSMRHRVLSAVFTRFAPDAGGGEPWICITTEDGIVHSFGTSSGRRHATGLPVRPHTILAWPEHGLVLTAVHGDVQRLFLLAGPESLLRAIVPSSLDAPITADDELRYFGERVAVTWNRARQLVTAYEVRMIKHHSMPRASGAAPASTPAPAELLIPNQLATSAINIDAFAKAAVISPFQEWQQLSVGQVFCQDRVGERRAPGREPAAAAFVLALHDVAGACLYTLTQDGLACSEGVEQVAEVAGIHRFRGIFVVIRGELWFKLLALPHVAPLKVPLQSLSSDAVAHIYAEPDAHWVEVRFANDERMHHAALLQLASELDEPMRRCFDILEDLLGFHETGVLALEYLALRVARPYDWDAFAATVVAMVQDYPPEVTDAVMLQFHLLAEDISLVQHDEQPVSYLRHTVQTCTRAVGDVSIYRLLISILDKRRLYSYIPELVAGNEQLYPNISLVLLIFNSFALNQPAELKKHIEESRARKTHWAYGIQMCILEIINQMGLTEAPAEVPRDVNEMAAALFPADLRYQEALRLLRTDAPQRCLFGVVVDQSLLDDLELQRAKTTWSDQLAARAYLSAYGQAAVNIHSRSPFLWEQLFPPPVNCNGICTETGITLKSDLSDLALAESKLRVGVFAQGVCLGMSITPGTTGTDSLWVFTSTELSARSPVMFAGFVLGTGLSGHLSDIEDWQFYESLVKADTEGMLATLLGLATSKRGTRDPKLTKVLSVHIRALLPEDVQDHLLVNAVVEQSALVALGLLFLRQADRYLTGVLVRELQVHYARTDEDVASADGRNVSAGIALGLINLGKQNLEALLPLVTHTRDAPVYPPGVINGGILALLLGFVGSNNKLVAAALELPRSALQAHYYLPHTLFSKALARHLILWDSTRVSREWVLEQIPACLLDSEPALEEGQRSFVTELWYDYALAGALTALAMQHVSSNDAQVVALLLDFIENHFLRKLQEADAVIEQNPKEFDAVSAATELAGIVSALALAAAAVCAGHGNVDVLRLLRELWQVQQQYFARLDVPAAVQFDQSFIAQAIGWLFLRGGQWVLKSDKTSVAVLACFSFAQVIAGPNVESDSWSHLKFFWSLVTEKRCLYALPDPCASVNVKIVLQSPAASPPNADGEAMETDEAAFISATMPVLLPRLPGVSKIVVDDDRYMPKEVTAVEEMVAGMHLVRKERPEEKLDTMLDTMLTARSDARLFNESKYVRAALKAIARQPKNETQELELHLLLAFYNNWAVSETNRLLSKGDVEDLKLLVWSRTQGDAEPAE